MPTQLKLFSAAVAAQRNDNIAPGVIRQNFAAGARAILAVSEDEALGKALHEALQSYPSADGWSNQSACVFEIPQDFIDRTKAE